MATVRSLCVYCGSGSGHAEAYGKAAVELGAAMAKANIRLVYGGGGIGLMGTLAKSVVDHGGKVLGIIRTSSSARKCRWTPSSTW